ncbi:hypothetical protein ACFXTH_038024 [Malus domestica]
MSANEYYRKFTDLSRYDPEVAANSEFYEVLLRIEDSENMPNESEYEEEKNENQRRDEKGKGQSSQGPRKTQSFKRNGGSSSSSSGGLSSNLQKRGGVIIGIMRSVGEIAVHAILVDKWGIRLLIALRISRGPNILPYHYLCRTSKFQDLVVMPRLDEEVLIIVKAKRLLMPQDSISTLRILIIRVVTLSIREVLCLISHIQPVDPSGIKGDSPSR